MPKHENAEKTMIIHRKRHHEKNRKRGEENENIYYIYKENGQLKSTIGNTIKGQIKEEAKSTPKTRRTKRVGKREK